jgi:hypothetical protein
MLAKDTITAEMAFMFMERNRPGSTIDYPLGGSGALVEALVRGLKKHRGHLELQAHVDEIIIENGRAAGVRLKPRTRNGPQHEVCLGNGNTNRNLFDREAIHVVRLHWLRAARDSSDAHCQSSRTCGCLVHFVINSQSALFFFGAMTVQLPDLGLQLRVKRQESACGPFLCRLCRDLVAAWVKYYTHQGFHLL